MRALRDGAEVIVMVHADNQYDPGLVAEMAAPILAGEADVVIGSRLLDDRAIAGGMPRWKWLGNRLLTGIENRAFGVRFSEYHTGYRAFSADFLRSIPFLRNSDDFVFDQEIFAQMLARGGARAGDPDPDALLPRGVDRSTSSRACATRSRRCGCSRASGSTAAGRCCAAPPHGSRRTATSGAILVAALAIRIAFVLATPDYQLVHDALDYDRHAASIADRARVRARPTGARPRSGRPRIRSSWPACTSSSGVGHRRRGSRPRGSPTRSSGTGIVALIGLIAFQLWGRREALIALALGAVYVPLILVGQSVMSEPLFVLCLLGRDRRRAALAA